MNFRTELWNRTNRTTLLFFFYYLFFLTKKWTSAVCGGVRAHPSHPPSLRACWLLHKTRGAYQKKPVKDVLEIFLFSCRNNQLLRFSLKNSISELRKEDWTFVAILTHSSFALKKSYMLNLAGFRGLRTSPLITMTVYSYPRSTPSIQLHPSNLIFPPRTPYTRSRPSSTKAFFKASAFQYLKVPIE